MKKPTHICASYGYETEKQRRRGRSACECAFYTLTWQTLPRDGWFNQGMIEVNVRSLISKLPPKERDSIVRMATSNEHVIRKQRGMDPL